MRSARPRIAVLDGEWKAEFYAQVRAAVEADWIAVRSTEIHRHDPSRYDLLVLNDEFGSYGASAIGRFREASVPTLHLIDGILDWNNCWDNPRSATESEGMPLFQPVLADKIACLGAAQARLLEYWGNLGRCEVTGSPRLDGYLEANGDPAASGECLIVTANNPGFTDRQRRHVIAGLRDLKAWFDGGADRPRPRWRIAKALWPELEIDPKRDLLSEGPMIEAVQASRVMISTPSTCLLEGMLGGRPVVTLDYQRRPVFVATVWRISGPGQIDETIGECLSPDPRKMDFQRFLLTDQLAEGPAAPRVCALILAMVDIGRRCRERGEALEFPFELVPSPAGHRQDLARRYRDLHPNHPVFAEQERVGLMAALGHERNLNRKLVGELARYQQSTILRLARGAGRLLQHLRGGKAG